MTTVLEEDIWFIFDRILFAEAHAPAGQGDPQAVMPLTAFGDIFYLQEIGDRMREIACFKDVTPNVIWPVDITLGSAKEDHIFVDRLQTVPLSQVRGRVRLASPYMAKMTHAWIYPDRYETDSVYVSYLNNRWIIANANMPRMISVSGNGGRVRDSIMRQNVSGNGNRGKILMGMALTLRYEWTVAFRPARDAVGISIATDPTGLRALFKDRDTPPSKDRRAALRTWVSEHMRKKRNNPNDLAFVRRHLRGATEFTWRGLHCVLRPSEFDLEKNAGNP